MHKVLLIHNDSQTLMELQRMIIDGGDGAVTAETLKRANKILDSDPYIDILIIGPHWPKDTLGIFLNNFKNVARFSHIPILMVSGSLESKDILKYCHQGVRDFIIWPTTTPTLSAKMIKAMENGKPTVLVVDDDEVILDLLSNILELERFKVHKASNGQEALALLDEYKIDVVISDILMPEMTGMELLGEIKGRFPQMPVILITGFPGEYTPKDVSGAGADGYFSKPFKNTELVRKLRTVVDKYRSDTKKIAASAPPPN